MWAKQFCVLTTTESRAKIWYPVSSKAVVLLLLNCCLVCFRLVAGAMCLLMFFVHYFVLSIFQSSWKEKRAGCFAFNVLRTSCNCKCPVTLSHKAVGRSAVCDCGVSWSCSLTFCWTIKSKAEGKEQEYIQSTTTLDLGHRIEKSQNYKKTSHTRPRGCQPFHSRWSQICS